MKRLAISTILSCLILSGCSSTTKLQTNIFSDTKEISSMEPSIPRTKRPKNCPEPYNPVCGIDGKTYSNRCMAEEVNQLEIAHEGEC